LVILDDVYIASNAYIKDYNMKIGSHVAIDHGVYSTVKMEIGDYVHISPYCSITGGLNSKVIFENFSFVSAGTRVICAGDNLSGLIGPTIPKQYRDVEETVVHFEKHAGTYSNCIIGPGSTISKGSVIAANSYFKGVTIPWVIYGGSPAKPIGERSQERIEYLERQLNEENI